MINNFRKCKNKTVKSFTKIFMKIWMAAITKNRYFLNFPLLLYYKSKCAHIVTVAAWQ